MKNLYLIILWIHFRSFSGYPASVFNVDCRIYFMWEMKLQMLRWRNFSVVQLLQLLCG